MRLRRTRRFATVEVIIEAPASADALVRDAEAAGSAEQGYWAHVWPAAESLAEFVARSGLIGPGVRVLEIGCGVGLVGLVAAARGATVTLTDSSPEAVRAAARNVTLNGVNVESTRFDWRDVPDSAWRPDVLLGADVLYDPAAHAPIARLIARLGCISVLGYPMRPASAGVVETFREAGLSAWDTAMGSSRVLIAQSR